MHNSIIHLSAPMGTCPSKCSTQPMKNQGQVALSQQATIPDAFSAVNTTSMIGVMKALNNYNSCDNRALTFLGPV